jgi:hypothetical protein
MPISNYWRLASSSWPPYGKITDGRSPATYGIGNRGTLWAIGALPSPL